MRLELLKTHNYRNLADKTLTFPDLVTMFVGNNGQGKTNFLEAIYFLGTLKSFRTSRLEDLTNWTKTGASVFGEVSTSHGKFSLGISLEGKRKKTFINGEPPDRVSNYYGKLVVISFIPSDTELIKGSPETRRKFLDKHVVDSNSMLMQPYLDYTKALRNKNNLLKDGDVSRGQLDPWDEIIAERGALIREARINLLTEIERRAAPHFSDLSTGRESVRMKYFREGELQTELTRETFDREKEQKDLLENLIETREIQIRARQTIYGPHRDDFHILLNENDSRAFASQGQTRSIVLALKMALVDLVEEKLSESPVVLLDDIDAELDRERRESLLKFIFSGQRQVFITTTELREEFASILKSLKKSPQKALRVVTQGATAS